MDLKLDGHAVVVTGASSGLAFATARLLHAEGASLVLGGRSQSSLDRARWSLDEPDRVVTVAGDNATPDTSSRLIDAALDRFGRVDGAMVSVGGPPPGTAMESDESEWEAAFASITLGSLRIARAAANAMTGAGSLVFVLSTSVREPIPNLAISSGLRPGLAMLTKQLADELGTRQIRSNALLPGRIATERMAQVDVASGDAASAQARAVSAIPLRRYGEPAEFAHAAAFLLSPVSSYISGAMLPVDGGALRSI